MNKENNDEYPWVPPDWVGQKSGDTRAFVSIPVGFPDAMANILRHSPETWVPREDFHERLGWFVCAYELLVKAATEQKL